MENYKVKVNSEAESKEVQELLFELGLSWIDGSKEIMHLSSQYIYTTDECSFYCGDFHSTFNESGRIKITIQQLKDTVVLKRNSIDDANFKDTFGDIWYVDSNNNYWMFENDVWRRAKEPLFKLELIEKPMKTKEYLDTSYVLRNVKQTTGDNRVPDDWIEIPEGAYSLTRCENTLLFWNKNESMCMNPNHESEFRNFQYGGHAGYFTLNSHTMNKYVVWKRNASALDNSIQEKLKFIEKWLNSEKIQYILGVESEKTQWHNFTEGAMQYIKRSDIKFREAPKYVTINGIEFKSVESLLKYVKNNFDMLQ